MKWIKRGMGLMPFDEEAQKKFDKWKADSLVECEPKQPRNYEHHKKFFALVDLVYKSTEEFTNSHECLEWFKIKCGVYKTIKVGETYYPITGSISFAKMSQDDFNIFYDRAIDSALTIIPIDKEELATMIAQF